VDDWPQWSGDGSRHNRGGLLLAVVTTTLLARRLVEPTPDESLPVFVEVPVGDHTVAFPHLHDSVIDRKRSKSAKDTTQTRTTAVSNPQILPLIFRCIVGVSTEHCSKGGCYSFASFMHMPEFRDRKW